MTRSRPDRLGRILRTVTLLVIVGSLLCAPTRVSAQVGQRHAAKTEVWMRGSDVVLSRHVPRGGDSEQAADEFARSMLKVAQQRYEEGDRESAEWLVGNAMHLSNGRVNADDFAEMLAERSNTGPRDAAAFTTTWPISGPGPLDPIPPSGAADHLLSPISTGANEFRSQEGDIAGDGMGVNHEPRPGLLGGTGTDDPQVGRTHEATGEATSPSPPTSPQPASQGMAAQPFFVAALPPHGIYSPPFGGSGDPATIGVDKYQNVEAVRPMAPLESMVAPITIAAIGFSAGAVTCAAICAMLWVVPGRVASRRQSEVSREPVHATPASPRRVATAHDEGNAIIEEFFNQNVDLYGELAKAK